MTPASFCSSTLVSVAPIKQELNVVEDRQPGLIMTVTLIKEKEGGRNGGGGRRDFRYFHQQMKEWMIFF